MSTISRTKKPTRNPVRSIERGLDRMTMDQTSRIRRMRKRMEAQDQAPIYDQSIRKSIQTQMK